MKPIRHRHTQTRQGTALPKHSSAENNHYPNQATITQAQCRTARTYQRTAAGKPQPRHPNPFQPRHSLAKAESSSGEVSPSPGVYKATYSPSQEQASTEKTTPRHSLATALPSPQQTRCTQGTARFTAKAKPAKLQTEPGQAQVSPGTHPGGILHGVPSVGSPPGGPLEESNPPVPLHGVQSRGLLQRPHFGVPHRGSPPGCCTEGCPEWGKLQGVPSRESPQGAPLHGVSFRESHSGGRPQVVPSMGISSRLSEMRVHYREFSPESPLVIRLQVVLSRRSRSGAPPRGP
jgi:hypothetical protein